jgi:hypothetical protein
LSLNYQAFACNAKHQGLARKNPSEPFYSTPTNTQAKDDLESAMTPMEISINLLHPTPEKKLPAGIGFRINSSPLSFSTMV